MSQRSLLSEELDNLKDITQSGRDLEVVWSPSELQELSGEVKGNTIYVYETEPAQALDTLRHEFLDYLVSEAVKPYQKVTALYSAMINTLIERLVDEAYSEKEKVIDSLMKILKTHASDTRGAAAWREPKARADDEPEELEENGQ